MNSQIKTESNVPIHFIKVGGHELHYLKIGNGAKFVLAFHGFANDATMFLFLQNTDYTILSFDLPFQGKTIGIPGKELRKVDLKLMVEGLMDFYQISKFSLLGFSLGCRACLSIAEELPKHVRNQVLIAPDGIRPNYYYQFLTSTALGRFSFRGFVRFGQFYLTLFAFLYKIGLLNRTMYLFFLQYIRTAELRQRLYNIWFSTRKLIPNLPLIRKSIRSKHIPTHLLMGQQDKIIPVKNGLKFKGNNPQIFLHVFERGHNLLDFEEVRGTVAAWLFRINSSSSNK
jgi:pimeloyl-ACP methyl ester carboxylesterase